MKRIATAIAPLTGCLKVVDPADRYWTGALNITEQLLALAIHIRRNMMGDVAVGMI